MYTFYITALLPFDILRYLASFESDNAAFRKSTRQLATSDGVSIRPPIPASLTARVGIPGGKAGGKRNLTTNAEELGDS